ncbi:4-galactosyl-N-acetylglucosaminide 3-alpha-L-fucosyltransferase FUT6-like isoform X2 [Cydia pomonella]|uniref:4-galactosyl-N-acetylglucosaminide 3-alpha-L-fucosyltransferase FUT6-like isoform X2 n=1 Tax=Cydia pomonella TaxID=82600 RepID=UPI002ADD9276|nr:4-galactosyl-N-acetylglucosaminide 3-alpha-L-fucosyltransferase FUT6-like isoform X2 [Cydia pomonella]
MKVRKCFSSIIKYFSIFMLCSALSYLNRLFVDVGMLITPESMRQHQKSVEKYYESRKDWMTSNLGAYMFKYSNAHPPSYEVVNHPERGYFTVLIWKQWPSLKERHVGGFGKHSVHPLFGCSVTNCKFFEDDDTLLSSTDAVVVHLHKGELPDSTKRRPYQRWIFWTDESPVNIYAGVPLRNKPSYSRLANMFNWSMSYRCPGHFKEDCPVIAEYLFYVVIENSKCRQYISEKIFHHAYSKGAIPIIMGTPLEDCKKLLPPNSFIHMDNFASIKHLAREIYTISDNITKLLSYHAWRVNFEIVEEHGFLGTRSLALCRICEALNYNSNARKVYGVEDIMLYLNPAVCCVRNP